MKKYHLLTLGLLCLGIITGKAQYTILHSFNSTDGGPPQASSLTPSITGDTLYGMTVGGGTYGDGVIFSINKDGNDYTEIYTFGAHYEDVRTPAGSLTLSVTGDTLFGMSNLGGIPDYYDGDGGIFCIRKDGTGYTNLFLFSDSSVIAPDTAIWFCPSLTVSGNQLFGMIDKDLFGGCGGGTIFSLTIGAGGNFNFLDYLGGPPCNSGANPTGSLTLSGNLLYGMLSHGGAYNDGCIFSMYTNGGGYTDLFDFGGTNGSHPYGSLMLSGGILYGMTNSGGIGAGVLFSFNPNGNIYKDLYNFVGDGDFPFGSLTRWKGKLYGMTYGGGTSTYGVIFSIDTDGTGYSALHNFSNDGNFGSLITVDTGDILNLLGMAAGGTYNDGVIFDYSILACTLSASANATGSEGCYGESTGSASASHSGGVSPYSYLWSNGATTGSIYNLTAGSYSVTITDGGGCQANASVTVTQPSELDITMSPVNSVSCYGGAGSATANTTGGTPFPVISSVAGNGTGGYNGTGITATSAELEIPVGVAVDGSGNIYIADTYNQRIRKVNTSGIISTVAGNGTAGYNSDGIDATTAELNYPAGIAVDGSGNIYISDDFNQRIRKVNTSGIISTVAGNGTVGYNNDGISATSAELNYPEGVAVDGSGNIYIADKNNNRIRQVNTSGIISSVAGNGTSGYNGTGINATTTELNTPFGVAIDALGNIYIADTYNQRIRQVNTSGIINTLAGNGTSGYGGDGNAATSAEFNNPYGVAVDASGDIFIADAGNQRIRLVNNNGIITTAAGNGTAGYNGDGVTAASAELSGPEGVAVDASGNIYIADASNERIRKLSSSNSSLYTYSWSNGGTISTASNLSPGTYSLTVADFHGCTTNASCTITQPTSSLGITISSVINACNGGAGIITANSATGGTPPYTYSWSGAGGYNITAMVSAGTYTITATDNHGCTASVSAAVTQPATAVAISISSVVNAHCIGGVGTATANVATGGVPPYTYSWSGSGGTNLTATNLIAGIYTIKTTDNHGCTATAAATITQPAALGITISSVTNALCNGDAGSATANIATGGTSPYTYSWSGGGGTNHTASLIAGTYTITAMDNCGNSASASVTITQPIALSVTMSSITNPVCYGETGSATATLTENLSTFTKTFSYEASVQHFTVPAGVTTLTVSVTGASGGSNEVNGGGSDGASFTGICSVISGHILSLVIGGEGLSGYVNEQGSGGGGASWVYDSTLTGAHAGTPSLSALFAVAGGGGGSGFDGETGGAGGTNLSTSAATAGIGGNGAGGTGGNGGTAGTNFYPGTGGAGWISNGGNITGAYPALGGKDWTNGFTGGAGYNSVGNGGYGGGGGGGYEAGAGGGGYNGGGGGNDLDDEGAGGGGGGSYLNGYTSNHALLIGSITASNSGNGSIVISYSALVPGGISPYTYSWSGGRGTNITSSGLSAGTYTMTVHDNNGCSATASATITQPTMVGLNISSVNNVLCPGGTGSVTANAATGGTSPYTYSWSGGGGTNLSSSYLSAGTYTITAKDNNGCIGSTSATITEPSSSLGINIASVTNANCNALGTVAANIATGGTLPYTYSWSGGGGTNLTATGFSAGTYTITVNDNNGCGATSSATITQPVALGITISSVTNVLCNGTDAGGATANAATGGTPPYTYSWSPRGGTNLETLTSLNAGTYIITVTDNSGCTSTASATITQPLSSIQVTMASISNVSCFGGTGTATVNAASGGVSPYTYFWIPSGGNNLTATLTAGTYTLQAVDNNGCSTLAYASITQPNPIIASGYISANVSCNGSNNGSGSVNANGGTAPYTYSWSNNAPTNSVGGLTAGNYSVTITDANLCSTTASVTITQPNILTVYGSASGNILCNGSSGGIGSVTASGGTAPYTYSWSNNATTSSVSGLQSGSYIVTVTDNNECTVSTSITITQPGALGVTILSVNNVSCPGGTGTIVANTATGGIAPYTYSWSGDAGTNLSATVSAGTYTLTVTDFNECIATISFSISQPAALGITIASVTNVNCNGESGSIVANTATGGTAPYTYSWNGLLLNSPTASNLVAGTYTITVLDNNGCSATASAIITQPSSVGIGISGVSNVNCYGGTGSITANAATGGTGPYTYAWEPNLANTLTATGLSAGTYTIIVIDNHGCNAMSSASITQPALALGIIMASQTNALCNGSTGTATANAATGGTAPYTYSWSRGGGTNLSATFSAGTYTVTATDNHGCTVAANATITQPAIMAVSTIVTVNESCNGGATGKATASVSGGTSAYTYSWAPGGGSSSSATGLSAGTYTVYVTSNGGCTATASVIVTQPASMNISTSITTEEICNGGATGKAVATPSGGTSPYTYSWSQSGGSASSATGLSAGTYTVHITSHAGCTATASVTITQPAAMTVSISMTANESCNGGTTGKAAAIASGGTSPYTYSWSSGRGSTSSVSGLSAGTYIVHITGNGGCTATASVIITQPASMNITTSIPAEESCNGGATGKATASVSGGNSPYTYSWAPRGGNTSSASGLSAGIYTLHITSHSGCTASVSITITQPEAIRDSISTSTCNNSKITATVGVKGGISPYTYSWSRSGGTKATATGLTAGTYTISIHDNHDCSSTLIAKLSCNNVDSPVKDTDNGSYANCCLGGMDNVNLYPNPNSGQFKITGIVKGMFIEIYDYTGKKINVISVNEETMQLNISNESNGIYLIRIIDKDGNLVSRKKVVKTQ